MKRLNPFLIPILITVATACSPDPPAPSDASPPEQPPMNQREINVSLQVPDLGWAIRIQRVYRAGGELWVISRLTRSDGIAAQAISTASDSVQIHAPEDLPVRHFILGKTWNWENEGPHTFLDDPDEIADDLKNAELFYPSGKSAAPRGIDPNPLGDRGDIPLH